MADYAKLFVNIAYSENSDYSDDQVNKDVFDADETRPDLLYRTKPSLSASGTVPLDLSPYNAVHYVVIQNTSSSYGVDVAWTNNGNSNTQRVGAGRLLVIDNPTIANDIVLTATSSGAVVVQVLIYGVATAL